jgi:predicted nucleic acid-binding protein
VITAIDSSILLDIILNDPTFKAPSTAALEDAGDKGRLIVCEVVWAELRAAITEADEMFAIMEEIGVHFEPMGLLHADIAGDIWRTYRQRGGKRERILPDFMIGAHAIASEARLLTRDRGFFRRYFVDHGLVIVEP